MQFVQEYPILDPVLQKGIVEKLRSDTREFTPSLIYDSLKDQKELAPEERISIFKTYEDKDILDDCQKLVDLVNHQNDQIKFVLVRNNATYIKYQEGEFFKPHEDYLSLTSNLIQEYTMIMCVDANCQGGETVLHFNQHFKHASQASITPLHILIFRKDIKHEGALIEKGYKEIMSLNLWAVDNKSDRVVVIDGFKDSQPNQKYIIPMEKITNSKLPENMLKSFISFRERSNGKNEPVLSYQEKNYTYEQFYPVYAIYMEYSLNRIKLEEYQEIIGYYGFDWKNVMVKGLKLEYDLPAQHQDQESMKDENLILMGDQSKYLEFLHRTKELLLDYIPFKMILIEGSFHYGGGLSGNPSQHVVMTPVYLSVSETDNLYYLETLVSTGEVGNITGDHFDLVDHFEQLPAIKEKFDRYDYNDDLIFGFEDPSTPQSDQNSMKWVEIDEDDEYQYFSNPTKIKMNLQTTIDTTLPELIKSMVQPDGTFNFKKLTGLSDQDIQDRSWTITPNYYLDDQNKLKMTDQQLDRVNRYLDNNLESLTEKIIERMNRIKFVLPQIKDGYEHSFCNEDVYGNVNFMMVYGFFKII